MAQLIGVDESLPVLTDHLPKFAGVIKQCEADFFVDEIPLYEPDGTGGHLWVQMEKKGLPTLDAVTQLGKRLKIGVRQIGYAGMKDARAVTRQWVSLENVSTEQLEATEISKVKILQIRRHRHKLKLGHLRGNRFIIRIRELDIDPDQARDRTRKILDVLERRGVPNYFGPQRFGARFDSHLLGASIIDKKFDRFLDYYLGLPDSKVDPSVAYVARTYYDQGLYEKAHDAWPTNYANQRRALRCLIKSKADDLAEAKVGAFNILDKRLKRFFVSAFQSDLFNQVIVARMPGIDMLEEGDLAYKHNNGACFEVEEVRVEQPRCDAFEISPSGPLFGYRMAKPSGRIAELESAILERFDLTPQDFRQMGYYKVKGARRSLRFRPNKVKVSTGNDARGAYLQVQFELPSGCYATTLLREILTLSLPDREKRSH